MAKAVDLDDLEHTIEDIIGNVCGRKEEGDDTEFVIWLRKLLHKKLDKWRPKLLLLMQEDSPPYLILNPPANLRSLVQEWKGLEEEHVASIEDDDDAEDSDDGPGYLDDWLTSQGVTIFEPEIKHVEAM